MQCGHRSKHRSASVQWLRVSEATALEYSIRTSEALRFRTAVAGKSFLTRRQPSVEVCGEMSSDGSEREGA